MEKNYSQYEEFYSKVDANELNFMFFDGCSLNNPGKVRWDEPLGRSWSVPQELEAKANRKL